MAMADSAPSITSWIEQPRTASTTSGRAIVAVAIRNPTSTCSASKNASNASHAARTSASTGWSSDWTHTQSASACLNASTSAQGALSRPAGTFSRVPAAKPSRNSTTQRGNFLIRGTSGGQHVALPPQQSLPTQTAGHAQLRPTDRQDYSTSSKKSGFFDNRSPTKSNDPSEFSS